MTAPTETEATAVATTKADPFANLPSEYRAAFLFRQQSAQIVATLAGMNWGAMVDDKTRRAVANWGADNDVDVTTEIDVLGGKIYVNSRYFWRKMAEMTGQGLLEYAFADHVNADPRLADMVKAGDAWATNELARRQRLRIEHNIPEKAVGAVVFRIKPKSMRFEVVGVKWTGGGTQVKDPVGDAKPVETAESRAMRRAMLRLAERVKDPIADKVIATLSSTEDLNDRVGVAIEKFENEPKPRQLSPYPPQDETFEGTIPDTAPVGAVKLAEMRDAAHARVVTDELELDGDPRD